MDTADTAECGGVRVPGVQEYVDSASRAASRSTHLPHISPISPPYLSASRAVRWSICSLIRAELWTCLARDANLSVLTVSAIDAAATHAIIVVLQFPPSESASKRVSFESRYGTCLA